MVIRCTLLAARKCRGAKTDLDVSVSDVLDQHVDQSLDVVDEVIRESHLTRDAQLVCLGQVLSHGLHLGKEVTVQ